MKKIFILILACVWIVLSIVSVYCLPSPKAYETTEKIWVPEEYTIVNISDGVPISIVQVSVSGTASSVPFSAYMKHFSDVKNNLYIQTNGTVCYVAKKLVAGKEETFYTKRNYAPFKPGRSHKMKLMIGDLLVKNFYGFDKDIISDSIGIFSFWAVVIFGLYWFCHKISKEIKALRTKTT